jgi:hypothetical protein
MGQVIRLLIQLHTIRLLIHRSRHRTILLGYRILIQHMIHHGILHTNLPGIPTARVRGEDTLIGNVQVPAGRLLIHLIQLFVKHQSPQLLEPVTQLQEIPKEGLSIAQIM